MRLCKDCRFHEAHKIGINEYNFCNVHCTSTKDLVTGKTINYKSCTEERNLGGLFVL